MMASDHLTLDQTPPPHVVIVGAGFGGLYAAKSLARAPLRITVVDRRNHHLFQPLLYQVATAALSPADIAQPIRAILRYQKNVTVLMSNVRAVDVNRRTVSLDGEDLTYDYLVLATGSSHAYFGHDEWEAVAPGLKTLEDALEIRRRILLAFEQAELERDPVRRAELLTFAVVGGGPTGVELAGALAEIARKTLASDFDRFDPRETRVLLLEAGDRLLPTFSPKLARKAARALTKLGVEVRLGKPVTGIEPGIVRLGDEEIAVSAVLWAAGVSASPLSQSLGVPLDRAGRVQVEPTLSLPGHPEVLVVGDITSLTGPRGRPYPGIAPVAIQQGRWAAANIVRALGGEPMA
ncbi:MAG: NAD(P)/FAD-dependent oxidoreductase, partial [Chloroflexota bacterium]|nr:NAD(P)/FAD-dependent oxidoreductase [Chloroflexota bacterium]